MNSVDAGFGPPVQIGSERLVDGDRPAVALAHDHLCD